MIKKFFFLVLDVLFPQTGFEENLKTLSLSRFIDKSGGIRPKEYKGVTYLFSYKNNFARRAVWVLKYKNNNLASKLYAQVLEDYLLDFVGENAGFDFDDKFVLVPIPISKEHLSERLNNQCELVLKELERLSGDNFEFNYKDLIKIKNTKSQTKTLSKVEREQNVIDSFDVRDNHNFLNKKIILVDDVVTTGSTLHEAEKILLEAGAKEVTLLSIAH